MALNSMTGFARAGGARDGLVWQWELRSVNGKALDMRLRLPPGYDQLDIPARNLLAAAFKRGNLQVTLSVQATEVDTEISINEVVLDQIVAQAEKLRARLGGPPLQAEALLGIRGVVEAIPKQIDDELARQRDDAIAESLKTAITQLSRMRAEEGARLAAILDALHQRIAALVAAAATSPARAADAIRERLREQVARLMEANASFDRERLHQEAVLMATRSDIQEEIDRLNSHLEALAAVFKSREPVGRKLDFLSQEFNREANTLCSKAVDKSLTAIGLDLKTAIDQLREQVQNIE